TSTRPASGSSRSTTQRVVTRAGCPVAMHPPLADDARGHHRSPRGLPPARRFPTVVRRTTRDRPVRGRPSDRAVHRLAGSDRGGSGRSRPQAGGGRPGALLPSGAMSWGHRVRADLARPERPTGRDELAFHVVASLAIVAVVQVVDPGTAGELLLLLPALA